MLFQFNKKYFLVKSVELLSLTLMPDNVLAPFTKKTLTTQLFKHTSQECNNQEEFEDSTSDGTNSLTGCT